MTPSKFHVGQTVHYLDTHRTIYGFTENEDCAIVSPTSVDANGNPVYVAVLLEDISPCYCDEDESVTHIRALRDKILAMPKATDCTYVSESGFDPNIYVGIDKAGKLWYFDKYIPHALTEYEDGDTWGVDEAGAK